MCSGSPTINEKWIKKKLANKVTLGLYDEKIIRERAEQISV